MIPWLKNKIRLISEWFKISFLNKTLKLISLMLMYVITLGCSLLSEVNHANISQDRWWGAPIMLSPSLFKELSTYWIIDKKGSWTNKTLNFLLFSKIISLRSLFFLTFCEKMLRIFKIMLYYYSQLSKLSLLWFLWAFELSCCTNHDWICVSRNS